MNTCRKVRLFRLLAGRFGSRPGNNNKEDDMKFVVGPKSRANLRTTLYPLIILCIALCCGLPLAAQQKGQWLPGQYGLNAGVLPSPGFTYVNMDISYSTGTINDANGTGHSGPGDTNVRLWAIENIFFYVSSTKFLGGNLGFSIVVPTVANGSLTLNDVGITKSTWGLADTWVQPFTLGWHLKRADIFIGDAFMTPTGRYSPGARNNIGSGYFGNHLTTGATVYLTKNKGTSANIFTDWEAHGNRQGTYNTFKSPGQAFTDEWGFGQILPLKKDFSALLQLGVIGYDQWQITTNGGTFAIAGPLGNIIILPAKSLPYYSVHAVGGQATFILPKKNLAFFFKYEDEYKAYSRPIGNTLVIGGSWTLKIPKA